MPFRGKNLPEWLLIPFAGRQHRIPSRLQAHRGRPSGSTKIQGFLQTESHWKPLSLKNCVKV